ncbi:hypothetical protein GCM10009830_19080 [Glycomyces endophyticus]|uniref:Protein kinase domain-containing protein n=1 Tax=Glycomyces endophyticus TaxID=480996 RepID=A0ABN2GLE8_9ACTN
MQPLSPTDPDRIGPYRVFAELGRGAMGRVLLGAGPDGRLVAVKVIREWLVEDAEFTARFREEVRRSRQVSGLYTAAVLDAGPEDRVPWLASEFLRGPTLDLAVKAAGPLPEAAAIRLAAGLAAALESVHAAGVIHRDLKPGNVILEASGPRVIDFGIARAAEGSDLTRTGALIGTPGFMSPEQTRSQPLTAASDVFSLGSVLVMACTGTGPFTGASTLDTMNNVVRAAPDLAGVPDRVRGLAARCLAPEPGDRPTPAELLALIGQVAPSARPWPDAVGALADEQQREIARLLDGDEAGRTLVDTGPTMVTDPNRPAWVVTPASGDGEPAGGASPVPSPVPVPTPPPRSSTPPSPPRLPSPLPPHVPAPTGAAKTALGAGAAALVVCAAVAGLIWYGADRDDEYAPSVSETEYVEDCLDAGYDEEACEESWTNDVSSTWTGELHSDDSYGETYEEETYEEETDEATSSEPSQADVYIEECQWDGHSESECEASWTSDPSYTWTGELYGSSDRSVYIDECTDDGHSESECETSWTSDTSYTWTGVLYGTSEKDVYIDECTGDGHSESDCESSWYADPSYTWTGELF